MVKSIFSKIKNFIKKDTLTLDLTLIHMAIQDGFFNK